MEFINSINNESFLYYHFLDGYIDKDTGSAINNNNIIKYISSFPNIDFKSIYIADLQYSTTNNDIYFNYRNINNTDKNTNIFNDSEFAINIKSTRFLDKYKQIFIV